MSVDLLKRAAGELRKHASAAVGGKWLSLEGGDRLIAVTPDDDFAYLVSEEPAVHSGTADYIALMHPPVALALARLLAQTGRIIADFADTMNDGVERAGDLTETDEAAIALARAILREPS